MQFLFHDQAGDEKVVIKHEEFKYLIKVRRHKVGDTLTLRHEKTPQNASIYRLVAVNPRDALLQLQQTLNTESTLMKPLVVGWCIVDLKIIEKTLPMLNEMGVATLYLIWSERSQSGVKLNFERATAILKNSMQQCGRVEWMVLNELRGVETFLQKYPECTVFDFGHSPAKMFETIDTVLIGPEGGFSEAERKMFSSSQLFSLRSKTVLRSESAVLGVCSKILL